MFNERRDSLHSDAENFDVWCERCQRVHRYYTFTKEDHDRLISEAAKKLADHIDHQAMDAVYAEVYGNTSSR